MVKELVLVVLLVGCGDVAAEQTPEVHYWQLRECVACSSDDECAADYSCTKVYWLGCGESDRPAPSCGACAAGDSCGDGLGVCARSCANEVDCPREQTCWAGACVSRERCSECPGRCAPMSTDDLCFRPTDEGVAPRGIFCPVRVGDTI